MPKPPYWTAEVVGEMHLHRITTKQLAAEIGWTREYLSEILNGRREAKCAECKVKTALERMKAQERG